MHILHTIIMRPPAPFCPITNSFPITARPSLVSRSFRPKHSCQYLFDLGVSVRDASVIPEGRTDEQSYL